MGVRLALSALDARSSWTWTPECESGERRFESACVRPRRDSVVANNDCSRRIPSHPWDRPTPSRGRDTSTHWSPMFLSPPVFRRRLRTSHPGGRRGGALLRLATHRFKSCIAPPMFRPPHHSLRRPSSQSVTSTGTPGSTPGGRSPGLSKCPGKGVTPDTGPALAVTRSPPFIQWPLSRSVPSPQEREIRVRIPGVDSPPWCNGNTPCHTLRRFSGHSVPS